MIQPATPAVTPAARTSGGVGSTAPVAGGFTLSLAGFLDALAPGDDAAPPAGPLPEKRHGDAGDGKPLPDDTNDAGIDPLGVPAAIVTPHLPVRPIAFVPAAPAVCYAPAIPTEEVPGAASAIVRPETAIDPTRHEGLPTTAQPVEPRPRCPTGQHRPLATFPADPSAVAGAPVQAAVAAAIPSQAALPIMSGGGRIDRPVAGTIPRIAAPGTVPVERHRADPLASPRPIAMPLAAAAVGTPFAPMLAVESRIVADAMRGEGDPRPARPQIDDAVITSAAGGTVEIHRIAVAATGGTQDVPLDLGHHRWPAAMIDRIEALRDSADAADTRIRLVPDALGTIDVSVRKDGDTVHVHFTAEQAATRTILQDAQPRLAELAEARGLKLGQTAVDGGGSAPDPQARHPAPQPQRPTPASAQARRDADPEDIRIA